VNALRVHLLFKNPEVLFLTLSFQANDCSIENVAFAM
jgi:hypothetical protein